MANSILTIDMITRESLRILENNLVFARNVNKQYDSSFGVEGAKIGSSLRIRKPNRYTLRTGATLSTQDTTEKQETLTIDQQVGVDLNFTTEELTLHMDDFSSRIIKPAMATVANKVDLDGLAEYKNVYQQVGTPGTTPATAKVLLDAHAKMDEAATPRDGYRCSTVDPQANASLIDGLKSLFNNQGDIGQQYKNGIFGANVLGYKEISVDQNIARHTTGTHSTGSTPLVAGAPTEGASTIATDGWALSTAVLKQGDVFTIAGVNSVNPQSRQSTGQLQQFVVTADGTSDGSGLLTISISPALNSTGAYQSISALPADNAALTVVGTEATEYPVNMTYHRDAFVLGTADLILPKGTDMASRQVHNGVSIRIIRDYDINNDKLPCRLDILYGWKTVYAELASRLIG